MLSHRKKSCRAPLGARRRPRQNRIVIAGLASLALHVFLFLQIPLRQPRPHVETQIVEVEEKPSPFRMTEKPIGQQPSPSHARKKSTAPLQKKLSFDDLNPFRTQTGTSQKSSTGENIKSIVVGGNGAADDDASSAWGSGGGEFQKVEDFGLMNRLYERADAALFYPSVLASHHIQGWVNARLVITQNENNTGKCDWRQTKISSADAHLRFFILSVLKTVCEPDFKRFLRGRKTTNVDFSFQFAITEHNDREMIQSKNKIVGNVLILYRNSQQSVAEWHLGPLSGMFPIPYAALDIGWLQEHWETIINKKDPRRALNEYSDKD